MIASGGLSGGISSSIAGGNFWDGARQGIITSGLNHLAHSGVNAYQKHRFDREIDRAFGANADKPATRSTETISEAIENIPTLKRFHTKFLKKFPNLSVEYNENHKGAMLGAALFDEKVTYFTEKVEIYMFAFDSHRILSHVILHEFGHVNSTYIGAIFCNARNFTPNTALAMDEIYAHKFANHHGGSPLNTNYYNGNVKFLKGTIWKIDAETLALPSFD